MSASNSERIVVVDVLRAVALLGIVITHAEMGFLAGPGPGQAFMQFSALDSTVRQWVYLLIESKFFSIFSFLFGLSFAIQLGNAARKGASFAGRFAWRLTILFAIGLAHQLLFNGDILMVYAALGFLLIPLGKVRSGVLMITALLLLLNAPGMVQGVVNIGAPPPTPEQQRQNARVNAVFSVGGQQLYLSTKSGSLSDIARVNYSDGLEMKWLYQWSSGRLWITFGCFLLGVCAGRANLFRDTQSSRQFFRLLLVYGGAVAVSSTALGMIYTPGGAWSGLFMQFVSGVQKATLAAAYVAAITLLYWKNSRGLLSHLAPLGKMGLTTYLLQSLLLAAAFYGVGFGLMGEIGSTVAVGLGITLFIVQVFIASWWLQRFSMGPVEWLWRSLTQLRWQPLSRSPETTAR